MKAHRLALALLAVSAPAAAQTGAEIERRAREESRTLERWSRERGEALPPGPEMPRPDGPRAPENVRRVRGDWRCASTLPDTALHERPDPQSRVIGLTEGHAAVEQVAPTNGFLPVLHAGNRTWMRAGEAYPYRNLVNPAVRCEVLGMRTGTNDTVFRLSR